ncbi:E1-E2 ATPase, putative [Plasmodium relictum]|uniref:E1-E2 ATPase, putative n=1 Tax=Plasmodium relictum TaxID=85471 RepID=A0A1J1H9K6_PLARL|nr:E1-E2 ATPase, putative [Plasmodium relictum]CRH01604.1 E1-E2 ATPase, putative [Plasmodium relictum]
MRNDITKNLFTYDTRFFKSIFDKYMKDEDYSKELKIIHNSRNLLEEIISKENGLNFYLDENYDEHFLEDFKLPFFKKILKYISDVDKKNESPIHKCRENEIVDNENIVNNNLTHINNKERKIHHYFIFNKKINVINSYRIYYYCSNIIQSLPSLTYLSVIKIYLKNYPLNIFLSCIYFYTFMTYVCDRDNVIEFFESLIFSLIVTTGLLILTIVHYIKENKISLITSKLNDYKESYICRNFIKNKAKKETILSKYESKKTLELKKYSKYFFLKSFLNRINTELFDYELYKNVNNFNYVQEYYKGYDPFVYSSKKSGGGLELVNTYDNSTTVEDESKSRKKEIEKEEKEDKEEKEKIEDKEEKEKKEDKEEKEKKEDKEEKEKKEKMEDKEEKEKMEDKEEKEKMEDKEEKEKIEDKEEKEKKEDKEEKEKYNHSSSTDKLNIEEIFLDKEENQNEEVKILNKEKKEININKSDSIKEKEINISKEINLGDIEEKKENTNESLGENINSKDIIVIDKGKEKKKKLMNYIFFENNFYSINGKNILVGDIIYLFKGDMIPADGILLKSNNMIVDESNLLKSFEKKKKISFDEYIYEIEKSKKKKISVGELKKKKLNYFEILNLKVKMKFKQMSEEKNLKKKNELNKMRENKLHIINNKLCKEEEMELPYETKCGSVSKKKEERKYSKIKYELFSDERNQEYYQSKIEKNEEKIGIDSDDFKKYDYSPLLLSGSIVKNGRGIMIATCVSKNKQMFHNSIKKIEENTTLEELINNYSKNVVILIIFCCSLCILFILIHFIINLIENDMQTFAYNLLMFLLNSIILEILKYFLLSIDQMPLLLQNCLALNSSDIMKENFIIKRKNTFEDIIFTNTIFIDMDRYIKYKCILFFYNSEFSFCFDNILINSNIKIENNVKLFNKINNKEIINKFFFFLLIQSILTTSNLYQYNEHFLDIDFSLLKFLKCLEINLEDFFIERKDIFHIVSNNRDYVISLVFLKKSLFLDKWSALEINKEIKNNNEVDGEIEKKKKEKDEKINKENKLNTLRIFIKGYASFILPRCSQYINGNNLCKDIEKLREKANKINEKKENVVFCFAYKNINLNEEEKENILLKKYEDDENFDNKNIHKSIDDTYLKHLQLKDLTCISVLVLEKTLSKHFFFDYKILEENDLTVKFFTKENLSKVNDIFYKFPKFFENLKLYDAKKINQINRFDYYGNFNKIRKKERINLEDTYIENYKSNNDNNFVDYGNLYSYKLKKEKENFNFKNSKSEVLNVRKYNSVTGSLCNEVRLDNTTKISKTHNFILSKNFFYNCSHNELLPLLSVSKIYSKNALVTNQSDLVHDGICDITVCDNRSKDINKEKCDIIILNKSLYDYIKLKSFSNCMLTNIRLYIDYNITFYIVFVIFSIISTLVNGSEFLSIIQILYIFLIKNVIFHYISCYRKSSYSTGMKFKSSYDFFKEKDMNNIISSILSKITILLIVFLFGHLFIPESKWDFVQDDIREHFDFSEFSFLKDKQYSNYYYTIRSSIRFKKNLENLKIQNNIDVKNDYRTMNEWEYHISPNRHSTILFNIFFLFFFFSYIHIYIRSFFDEVQIYWNKCKNNKYEYFYLIKNREDKLLSTDINQLTKELKINKEMGLEHKRDLDNIKDKIDEENICSYSINIKQDSKGKIKDRYCILNKKSYFNEGKKEPKKEKTNEKCNLMNTERNRMLINCIKDNYKIFLIFFFILIIHIIVIQFGSFFFHFHVKGLTKFQWLVCFSCCLLDFLLYLTISRLYLFKLSTNSFKFSQYLYEPREKNVFDTLNDYKKSYMSQRYKYNLRKTRKSWI